MESTLVREEMKNWSQRFGLNLNSGPQDDRLKWALDPNLDTKSLSLEDTGDLMFVLSSYHSTLAAEMGRVYARMRWNPNDDISRAKLNIIKPQHDSIALKISVVKKLFDNKVKQSMRTNNA